MNTTEAQVSIIEALLESLRADAPVRQVLVGAFWTDELIALCRPDAFVLLLGASAPLSPVLLEAGVDAVSGTRVTDPERVCGPWVRERPSDRSSVQVGCAC